MPDIDTVLDWPVDYWQGGWNGEDEWEAVIFLCGQKIEYSKPDRRCKSGTRTWTESCHVRFAEWENIRELADAIAAHIRDAHELPAMLAVQQEAYPVQGDDPRLGESQGSSLREVQAQEQADQEP